MGVSKGELSFGRLNEGSPEGGEIRNLPPLAGSLPTFLPEQESRPPEAFQLSKNENAIIVIASQSENRLCNFAIPL